MPKFREITGQFVGYIPDSIDSDIVPDRAPMNGRVTFTPVFTGGVIAFPELVPPEFAHPRTIQAKIVDGFVRVEVNEGTGDDVEAVLQPLTLMVTVDDEASQVWSWRAEFDEILLGGSDEYVKIPAWSFRVPDGTGPVDLTELVPLKTSATVDVTKGPRGAGLQTITAVDGQLVFAYTDGEETTVPIPEAVQGPQGEPGPAGADGEQGPEGPQGPAGEIPDLLVGNITDATPTGKNLMLAATEGAARNTLGLSAGATAANGSLTELNTGTSSTPRIWTANNLATHTADKVGEAQVSVNVRYHGAVGNDTADDRASIQEAINQAGDKVVVLESGKTYHMATAINLPPSGSVTIKTTGTEKATLHVKNQQFPLVKFNTSATPVATTTLAESISPIETVWTAASVAGVEPGMLCELISSKSWYFDPRPETSDARKSEVHKVKSVNPANNTIVFEDLSNDGYDISSETVTMRFFNPVRVHLENIVFKAELDAPSESARALSGIEIAYADNPRIINCDVEDFANAGILLRQCYRPEILGGKTLRANNYYTGYGVQILGCSHSIIRDRMFAGCRRGVDVSGLSTVSWNNLIENCTVLGGGHDSRGVVYGWNSAGTTGAHTSEQYGMGTHGPAGRTTYRGNTTIGIKRPYSLRGYDETIENFKHVGRTHGGVIQCSDGQHLTVRGGSAVGGFTGALQYARFNDEGLNSDYRYGLPDRLVWFYNGYKYNPTSGVRYGNVVITGVHAELRGNWALFSETQLAAPKGILHVSNNSFYFHDVNASSSSPNYETAIYCCGAAAADTTPKIRWFIGPNLMVRGDRLTGSDLYQTMLVKNASLSGAQVVRAVVEP